MIMQGYNVVFTSANGLTASSCNFRNPEEATGCYLLQLALGGRVAVVRVDENGKSKVYAFNRLGLIK